MNPVPAVLAGVMLPAALAVATVVLFREPLFTLLVELCGNAARARFWAVFSAVVTVLSTLFGVLASLPVSDGTFDHHPATILLLTSLRAGIVGLLGALMAIAFILMGAIRKHDGTP